MRDWSGNSKSALAAVAPSNHSEFERAAGDFYATDPKAVDCLLSVETFDKRRVIWEPACGEGHISKRLIEHGYSVYSSDMHDRGYGEAGLDFLKFDEPMLNRDIITNPPYSLAQEFVEHALSVVSDGEKVAMFLKLTFLESKRRKALFEQYPPKAVYVFSSRVRCAKNGDFEADKSSSIIAYAWFVWVKGWRQEPVVRWVN